jgi:cobalamin biosynthesis protein CobD/CbiB
MISPIVVGLLGGAFAARIMMRRAWRRSSGGCGGSSQRWQRWQGRRGFGRFAAPDVDVAQVAAARLAAQVAALELNARQQEEVAEVFATIRAQAQVKSVSDWPALDRALQAISGDELDLKKLGDQPEAILDALEHLHTILTPEQRATLRT